MGFNGCPERHRRQESWNLLKHLARKSQLPWCILGDFNDIMFVHEKHGGRLQPRVLLEGFNNAITECGLTDLNFSGSKFTWERSRGTVNWIQLRLDRGLVNHDWRNMFPSAEINVLEVFTSDHLPLFLELNRRVYIQR